MSSGCGDVLSLADLQTAKKHQLFEAEVITGKQGGVSDGADIDYATNQVTGQIQKTMPAILRDLGFEPASFDFITGGTLTTSDRNKAVFWPLAGGGDGDWYYWEGVLPKVIPAASTPASTGGVSHGAWCPVGDITLREELASTSGASIIGTGSGLSIQQELDKIEDITNPSGTDKIGFRQDGAGSVDRALLTKAKERYSVGDKGGVPGPTNSSAAFQAAVDDLDTGNETITGGRIHAQIGKYTLSNNVILKNSQASRLSGLTLEGDGKQGTTLDFNTAPDTQDGLVFEQPTFCRVADLAVQKAGQAGIKLKGVQSGFGAWNHVNLQRIRTGFNGTYGVDCERGFMGHFEQVFATHAGVGTGGFRFQGQHTSMHLNNCYAASNGGYGYNINQFTYSVLNACASDSNAYYGYLFRKTHSTVVNGCGSESNGRSGFAATSSAADGENIGLTFNSIFGTQNNQSNGGYPNLLYVSAADNARNKVVLRGSYSQAPANGAVDVLVTGVGAYLVEEDNECPAGMVAQNGGYIHHVNRTKVVRNLSVTGVTTVVELSNPQGHQTDFSGEVTVVATNASPEIISAKNSAVYKLLVVKGFAVSIIGSTGLTSGGGASHPSFTWSLSGNNLQATPVGSTSGTFFFQILCGGPAVRVKTY